MPTKKITYFIYALVIGVIFMFGTSALEAQAQQPLRLHFGGKPKLPSIEFNIGAAYKAKRESDATKERIAEEVAIEKKAADMLASHRRRIIEEQILDKKIDEAIEEAIEEKAADQIEEKITDEAEDNKAEEIKNAEKERKKLALQEAQKLSKKIAQRKREEAIRLEKLKKEADEVEVEIEFEETVAEPVVEEIVEEVEEIAAVDAEVKAEEIIKPVEEIIKPLDVAPEDSVEELVDSEASKTEESIALEEVVEEVAVEEAEKDTSVFGRLKSLFAKIDAKEEKDPKLSDIPSVDTTVVREIEKEEAQISMTQPEVITEKVIDIPEVDENLPASMQKKKIVKAPVEFEPLIEEDVTSVKTKKPIQGDSNNLVINLPKPVPSGDALSIASMFESSPEPVPMPLSMIKKNDDQNIVGDSIVEDSSKSNISVASVEATESGNLLPPQSLVPSILNANENKGVEPKKVEVASLPPVTSSKKDTGVLVSLEFVVDEISLRIIAKHDLENVIEQMKSDKTKRLSIIGYASNPDDTAKTARRVSLKRALSVRKHLIDNGVDSLRVNVQAMGNEYKDDDDDKVKDRVDVFFIASSG